MSQLPAGADRRLDAYLDGALDDSERLAFQREMALRPELHAEVARQQAIDQSLHRLFAQERVLVPKAVQDALADPSPPVRRERSVFRTLRLFAIAASLTVVAAGAWIGWTSWQAASFRPPAPPPPVASVEALYRQQIDAGFTPRWVCADDKEFAATVRDKFGQALLVSPASGVAVIGWGNPPPLLSGNACMLLLTSGQAKTLVLLDDVANARDLPINPAAGLHINTRALGKVVLYEITPEDHSAVLDLFYDPDAQSTMITNAVCPYLHG